MVLHNDSAISPWTYQRVRAEIGTETSHLLLGNGFSISCDSRYHYGSLYDYACKHGLTEQVRGVFEHLGTNNFEGVLRLLDEGAWLTRHYGLMKSPNSPGDMGADHLSVRIALAS